MWAIYRGKFTPDGRATGNKEALVSLTYIYPHYDIPKKRIEDIQQKCEIVRTKEIITIIKKYQKNKVKFHTNKVY